MKRILLAMLLVALLSPCAYAQTTWTCGDTETIEWTATDYVGITAHMVEYSTNWERADWTLITNPTGDG